MKKQVKSRNLMALALHSPLFKSKTIPDKKKKQNKEKARRKVTITYGQE